jgi:hypothetical protein
MSYRDVAQMAVSHPLQQRVTGCVATEGVEGPQFWTGQHIWEVVAAPGWGDAWASALAGGMTNDEAGDNEGVITDAMILSQVQEVISER